MARSNEDLANAALSYLTRDTIRSLDETGPSAVQMKLWWETARDYVIEEFDWPECRVVGPLTAVSGIALRGWTYAYTQPADMVKIWGLNDGNVPGYTIFPHERGMSVDITSDRTYIFTNQAASFIRYGSNRASIGRFSAQVFDLMAHRLAIMTCMVLTKDKALLDKLEQRYPGKLSKVKTTVANAEPEVTDIDFTPETISVRSE